MSAYRDGPAIHHPGRDPQGHPVTECSPARCGREPRRDMLTLRVTINGTTVNPWHRFNLRQNPFPQLGIAEFNAAEMAVNSLDGDPIRDEADLRARLAGFADEFIELCLAAWVPGERVRFTVTFPRAREVAS